MADPPLSTKPGVTRSVDESLTPTRLHDNPRPRPTVESPHAESVHYLSPSARPAIVKLEPIEELSIDQISPEESLSTGFKTIKSETKID